MREAARFARTLAFPFRLVGLRCFHHPLARCPWPGSGCGFFLGDAPVGLLARRLVGMPDPAAPVRDFVHRSPGGGRVRHLLENVRRRFGSCVFVVGLDEQPRLLAFAWPLLHAHEVPAALQFLAVQSEFEVALLEAELRVIFRLPAAAIPDHHRAAAILAFGDGAFERVVLDRMIFDVDREPLVVRYEAWAAGDGPAQHHAAELQPKIVVQPCCGVLLDDVAVVFGP